MIINLHCPGCKSDAKVGTKECNDLSFEEYKIYKMRNHWQIENSRHWVLDITFRKDESRIREKMPRKILQCCVTSL